MDGHNGEVNHEEDYMKDVGIALIDDTYVENQDTRIYKIREKSYDIKKQLDNINETQIVVAKSYIKKLSEQFRIDFPALFVSPPTHIYVHIDLDSFYASVETLENPEYKTIPLAVGSMNMLTTCNYVARKYGIKAGMPGYIAKQMCPELKIVKCNFTKYNLFSEKVMSILTKFHEGIEIYGIDEACMVFDNDTYINAIKTMNAILLAYNTNTYTQKNTKEDVIKKIVLNDLGDKTLDIGHTACISTVRVSKETYTNNEETDEGCITRSDSFQDNVIIFKQKSLLELQNKLTENNRKRGEEFVDDDLVPCKDISFNFRNVKKLIENIRHLIYMCTGLTVSAGISVTRGLSKYSCGVNKPNGLFIIDRSFDDHILDLDTDKINGIGKATKELLDKAYGMRYIKDIRNNLHLLYLTLPYKSFLNLFYLSYGLSIFDVSNRFAVKNPSIGVSLSFKPTNSFYELCSVLWYLSTRIHDKLRNKNLKCNTLTLTYKFRTFKSKSKQCKMNKSIDTDIDIYNECFRLLIDSKVCTKDHGEVRYLVNYDLRLLGVSSSGLTNSSDAGLFNFSKVIYNHKRCIICNKEYLHKNNNMFEMHVNKCLDKKDKKTNIKDFFKKRKI